MKKSKTKSSLKNQHLLNHSLKEKRIEKATFSGSNYHRTPLSSKAKIRSTKSSEEDLRWISAQEKHNLKIESQWWTILWNSKVIFTHNHISTGMLASQIITKCSLINQGHLVDSDFWRITNTFKVLWAHLRLAWTNFTM